MLTFESTARVTTTALGACNKVGHADFVRVLAATTVAAMGRKEVAGMKELTHIMAAQVSPTGGAMNIVSVVFKV